MRLPTKHRFSSSCVGRRWSERSWTRAICTSFELETAGACRWPIVKEPQVPPQVIPVNYLRWDVIYPWPEMTGELRDVEAPHVRIVDMHPVERSGGVVIMGELLNEDVVPAYVTVKATLLAKNGSAIATEGSFDKISHVLLPKQVTPFLDCIS